MIVWLASLAAADDCVTRVAEVDTTLHAAVEAFGQLELDEFREHTSRLDRELGCLSIVPIRPTIAKIHRVQALRHFTRGEDRAAALAICASRRLDPAGRLPPELFPPGHAFWTLDGAIRSEELDLVAAPTATHGTLLLDGGAAPVHRVGLPVLVTWTPSGTDVVARSAYVPPDGRPTSLALPRDPVTPPPAAQLRRRRVRPIGVTAAGLVATAGGLYLGALASRSSLDDARTRVELEAVQTRTNGLVVGAAASAAVGLGLGMVTISGGF